MHARNHPLMLIILVPALLAPACGGVAGSESPQPAAGPTTPVAEPPLPTTTLTVTTAPAPTMAIAAPAGVTASELALAEAFAAAYNDYDVAALADLFASDTPELALTGGGPDAWSAEDIEKHLAFAEGVSDRWELDDCTKHAETMSCRYLVTDALIERVGLDPVPVTIEFAMEDGELLTGSIDLVRPFHAYDAIMHDYGHWYEEAYPGTGAIKGFHHRGWNVGEPAASGLFMEHLDEWAVSAGFGSSAARDELPSLETLLGQGTGLRRAPVPAGEYRVDGVAPLRLLLREDLDAAAVGQSFIALGPPGWEFDTAPTLTFVRIIGLPVPEQVASHDHAPTGIVPIEGSSDWEGFFADNEGLILLDSGTETIHGTRAPWWEFTVDPAAGNGYSCPYGANCFNIAAVHDLGFFIAGEDWTVRLWKLDHAEGTVYAWFQAPTDTYASDLELGTAIIEAVGMGS